MSRVVKILVIGLALVVGVVALGVGAIYALSASQLKRSYPLPAVSLDVPASAEAIARGRHLVAAVSSCMECHGEDLGGKVMMAEGPIGVLVASNLTRGAGGVAGSYDDADWVYAIRHGLRRSGRSLIMMPSEAYAHFTDADLGAVVAYLKQLPAVDRELPPSKLRILGRALLVTGQMPLLTAENVPPVEQRTAAGPGPTAEYGQYLAGVSGCTGCHGADLAGGLAAGPPGTPLSANLTPVGLGSWTEADFFRSLREGKRPDGSTINEIMPWRFMGKMTDDELRALWLYLQSVAPKETPAAS